MTLSPAAPNQANETQRTGIFCQYCGLYRAWDTSSPCADCRHAAQYLEALVYVIISGAIIVSGVIALALWLSFGHGHRP